MFRSFLSVPVVALALWLTLSQAAWGARVPFKDCMSEEILHGYIVLNNQIVPGRGPEGFGEVTFLFSDGSIKTGRVTADILTIPDVLADGSFSVIAKLRDEFSDREAISWIMDLRFVPTTEPLVYDVLQQAILLGGEGDMRKAYFGGGSIKATASFATGRIDIQSGKDGFICGLKN